ncbi:precorrin-6y C5,15-methyltransferase (decarboxylating) subunit CbiE [Nocardioides litoris]|uniref:precorrin-6y C5,15-methyltransferase (decarboxylating) subunit CbiE n=1 Tax=Nocardioides litoris TaxID=1926648 RepID=UPI001FE2F22C|nr:precorrin-6y C5,15-methyltransferase (decarboxylating) subunit CbiE [Nocardioides litoris]
MVVVVGMGADGLAGLAPAVRDRVLAAPVVVGGPRHLALLPDVPGQERRAWPSPFTVDGVPADALVLASGDPLVSGVATTLVRRLGADAVEVVPHVSSVALARARMRWSAEESTALTVVGRRVERVLRELAPGRRLLLLTSDEHTPARVAALLVGAGYGATRMTALADLGAAEESRHEATAAAWDLAVPRLHVLALDLLGPAGGSVSGSWAAGLPDDAFEHDGQLTKRDVRASALARLRPQPGQRLLDLGAGAGSVAIEWARAHPTCRATAVEREAERAARIARNAARLGVPDLEVVHGDVLASVRAVEGLVDAIFVGGGATAPGLLDACRDRLAPGGRLVVHGVTLETEQVLAAAYAAHGGELTRLAVETAAPIGSFTGWTPARAVTQWSWTREEQP